MNSRPEKVRSYIVTMHLFFKQRLKRVLGVHSWCIVGDRHCSPFFLIFHIPCGGLVLGVHSLLLKLERSRRKGIMMG